MISNGDAYVMKLQCQFPMRVQVLLIYKDPPQRGRICLVNSSDPHLGGCMCLPFYMALSHEGHQGGSGGEGRRAGWRWQTGNEGA